MLQSSLLRDTVEVPANSTVLVLNSAADPFVATAIQKLRVGPLILAEDDITTLAAYKHAKNVRQVAFHDYLSSSLHSSAASIDVAVMNLQYQPAKTWVLYGLQIAAATLRVDRKLYITGAKDRGILSIGKRMEELFGNVETLLISKGHRVLCSTMTATVRAEPHYQAPTLFADNKLDEGTRLLLETLEVRVTDEALDIGSGAGFIGLHIARIATGGRVTMVDASLAAVAASQHAVTQNGLTNVRVLPGNGVQAVQGQHFDLIATNPPFHQGSIQTTAVAESIIHGAAQVLHPHGRFYLVANRFLKYELMLKTHFEQVEEVGGNTRFKVLRATKPL